MLRARIAPTPSGYLHIGNALNFVLTWLWVRKQNGTLRLRIDDIDGIRARQEYLDDIFFTLQWLGIDYDEGPATVEQHNRVFSQQLRIEQYAALIEKLLGTGQVFACNCSRRQLQQGETCSCQAKNIALTTLDVTWRVNTIDLPITIKDFAGGSIYINLQQQMPSFAIRRRDGIPAYQVASLVDDTAYNINLIIRGADLLPSTAAQLYLARLSNNNTFCQCTFYHHRLINDEHGHKLSKSAGSTAIKDLRSKSNGLQHFYNWAGYVLTGKQNINNLQQLLYLADNQPILHMNNIISL